MAMKGFFIISEKAIRENPQKWQVPSRAGLKLAEKVQKESRPYVIAALKAVVQAERDRNKRARGVDLRSAFSMIPPQKR